MKMSLPQLVMAQSFLELGPLALSRRVHTLEIVENFQSSLDSPAKLHMSVNLLWILKEHRSREVSNI
jgi:hypothetical protein